MTRQDRSALIRRNFGLGALAAGAATLLTSHSGMAQNVLERLGDEFTGDLRELADDAREAIAYLMGMQSYVYGYPLVMMDVTREVLTGCIGAKCGWNSSANQSAGQDAALRQS